MQQLPLKTLNSNQIDVLNLIRFFSCLIVLNTHFAEVFLYRLIGLNYQGMDLRSSFYMVFYHSANFAVMNFFALSGFLLTYSALLDYQKQGYFSLSNYVRKRLLRILPSLWFSIILTGIVFLLIKHLSLFGAASYHLPGDLFTVRPKASFSIREMVMNLLLIPGATGGLNGPLWSLSYEVFYYIVFAILLFGIVNKQYILGISAAVAIAITVSIMTLYKHDYLASFYNVLWLAPPFFCGSLSCYCYTKDWLKYIRGQIYVVLFIVGLISLFVGIKFNFVNLIIEDNTFGLLSGFLMCWLLTEKYQLTQAMKYLSRGSDYTYTLYVIHFPLLLLTLSVIGYKLLGFLWYDYLILFFSIFVLMNCLSYYLSRFLENRVLLEEVFTKLKYGTFSFYNNCLIFCFSRLREKVPKADEGV